MHNRRRRSQAVLAVLVAIATVSAVIPVGTASAATTIYYRGAGSAPTISVIGDSTIAALRWTNQFEPLKRFNFVYDAESCRRTVLPSCRGREGYTPDTVLNTMRRLSGQLGSVVAIMGGYDDPGYNFGSAVDAVMAEAARQGIPRVMWLTLRTADVSYVGPGFVSNTFTFRDNNRILLQKALQYGPRLQIADWATYSANHPEWFSADGIHFTVSGATAGAAFIAAQAARVLAGEIITPQPGEVPILPWATLRRGDRGSSVSAVQRALIERGYPVLGGVDGVFASVTEDAVRRFQAANNLPVTGVVDEVTAIRLGLVNAGGIAAQGGWVELQLGMAGLAVAEAQQALMRHGIFVQGGADGGFGLYTWYSVRNFQRQNGLPVTGAIDEATAKKLGLFSGNWIPQRQGMRGTSARAVQQALVRLGVNLPGGITGTYSTGTYYAVKVFQRLRGLRETGVVDTATARALGVYTAPATSAIWSNLALHSSGPRVASAQRALLAAGIHVQGGASGVFDVYTWYSVRNFQRRYGLPITGTIDAGTAGALGLLSTSPPVWGALAVGAVGSAVSNVELALIAAGFDLPNGADGVFGLDTYRALREFQRSRSLRVSGVVDLNTGRRLGLLDAGVFAAPAAWVDLREGMAGTGVAAAQRALMRNRIFVQGGADGVFSVYTRYSVRNFQRQRGLPVTGAIDEQTARALGLFSGRWVDLRTGMSGSSARAVQQALVRLGVNLPGGITGKYSTGTYWAVRVFQRLVGLPETGTVDATTAAALGVHSAPDATSIWMNLSVGDSGPRVAAAQRALMAAGIFVQGGAHGRFNDSTWHSVRNFQRQRGLRVSGVIDVITARALGLFSTSPATWSRLAIGSSGTAVRRAELALIAAGFRLRSSADNVYALDTYQAVQRFQHARGLRVTGMIDLNTARALGLFGTPATAQVALTAAAGTATTTARAVPTTTRPRPTTTSTTNPTTTTTTTTSTTTTSTTTTSTTTSTTTTSTSTTSTTMAPAAPTAPPANASTIGGWAWLDADGNGLQDDGEAGAEGVEVALLDAAGIELARLVTDHVGAYRFDGVSDGTYVVELTLPNGHGIALANQGFDDEVDSDLASLDDQRGTARTDLIAVPSEHLDRVDLGLVALPDDGGATTTSSSELTTSTAAPTTAAPTSSAATTPTTEEPTTTEATTTTAAPTTSAAPTTVAPTTAPPTTVAAPTTTAAP